MTSGRDPITAPVRRSAWRHAVVTALVAASTIGAPASARSTDASAAPVAHLRQGDVSGARDRDLAVFKGMPFAAPPIGSLRWRPPAAPAHWSGVRHATSFAPACVQGPHPILNPRPGPTSEDCLYLNVWSPAGARGRSLPVIVWIHGGGFSWGATSAPLFDGAALARRGVVLVSVTYRLGPLGFLALPELSAESKRRVSGNYGLLDQIAALRWVRDNAAAFGGDPDRVTVMGESAGGESVRLLARSPLSRGLFARAIAESSADFGPDSGFPNQLREAEASGRALMARAGVGTLAALRALPAADLLRAAGPGPQTYSLSSGWPVVDGYVLPTDGREPERRIGLDRPILIGDNEDEWAIFPSDRTVADLRRRAERMFGAAASCVLAAYPARDDAEAARSSSELMSDVVFGSNDHRWAEAQRRRDGAPVYYYRFSQRPPARAGVPSGAVHGAELPYVFGTLYTRPLAWTAADRATADTMGAYWTNFARTGDPNGPGLPPWPRHSREDGPVLRIDGGRATPGPVPSLARLRLLERVMSDPAAACSTPGAGASTSGVTP